MANQKHIIVIGAGVTGLTSTVFLAEAGYRVTVVAAHVPGDQSIEYTSPWAGAHWRTSATPAEPMVCDWDVQTFKYWAQLLEREDSEPSLAKSGLKMQDSYLFWDSQPTEDLWWAPHVQGYRTLPLTHSSVRAVHSSQAPNASQIQHAALCRAPSVNVPQYLLHLRSRAEALGAEIIKSRLPNTQGLCTALLAADRLAQSHGRGPADLFLHATGLSAGKLCHDDAVHPIRGQTVLVRGEASATRTRQGEGYIAYCIPRPGSGTTILGGTKEVGVWSETEDEKTTRRIVERARVLAPELLTGQEGGFEVVSVQCGLRPGRKGGPRVEREVVGGREVVHAYGHGSGGYQNSIGSARLVVKLVDEAFQSVPTPSRARL